MFGKSQNHSVPQLPFDGIVKEGRSQIGSELATRFLNETNYTGQRKIDPSQVGTYAEMMRRGIWLAGSQIAFGRLDGALHLVNGQHRLAAVAQSGMAQEFQILIIACDTVETLRDLYFRFDAVMRPRTTEQLLQSAGVAEERGVSRSMATAVYRAIAFITNDLRSPAGGHKAPALNRIVDARLAECEDWWEQARQYEASIKGCQAFLRGRLHPASIVAVALVTLKHQPARAKEFWTGLAANDGLRKGDARHTLVQFLLTTHDRGSGELNMAACAQAWNAFYSKKPLPKIRAAGPISLNGTPFDGKSRGEAA